MLQRTQTLHRNSGPDDREQVEIFFSCRKLKNMDTFSKSDSKVLFFRQLRSTKTW